MRRDGDPSLLSYAQPLQGFVHPSDHISHADVSVIGAVSLVAVKRSVKLRVKFAYTQYILLISKDGEMSGLPRVEGRAVLEGAVVVVADVISFHRPARAVFRHLLHLHNQIVLRVEHVNHQHLEHQRGLRRDLSSC